MAGSCDDGKRHRVGGTLRRVRQEMSAMRQKTLTERDESSVEARACPERAERMPAAILSPTQAIRLPLQRRSASGFTLQKQRERASAPRRAVVPRMRGEGGFTLAELLVT